MILFEGLTIEVEKTGDIFHAFAWSEKTEEHIADCKCDRQGGAVSGVFHDLRNEALHRIEA